MDKTEFAELCARYDIDPSIALENDNVVDVLVDMKRASEEGKRGYKNILIQILETEF